MILSLPGRLEFVRRYLRIYHQFFRSSLQREMEFRANFFAKILQNVIWLVFFFAVLLVIYSNTDTVGGWTREHSMILAATLFLMNSIIFATCHSLYEVPEQVRKGTLDFVVVKPIDIQFWVSFRRFRIDQLGSTIAGIALLIYALVNLDRVPAPMDYLAYGILFVVSSLIYYSLILFIMTFSIYFVRIDNLWVLGETINDVARFPVSIFPGKLQRILTLYIPFAFLSSIPALQIIRGADWPMVGLGLGWAVVSLIVTRIFWNRSLRRYTSASS